MTITELMEILNKNIGLIVAFVTGLAAIYGWVAKPVKDWLKRLDTRLDKLERMDEEQNGKLDMLDKDTADLLCSQLSREHDTMLRRGWCTTHDKERIGVIYKRYKSRGRNHISERLMDDILQLPSNPPDGQQQ